MITETENAPSWAPVVVVALVAAVAGGALYLDPPLESQRPSDPSTVLEAPRHRQFPLARLWQDPLHVVYEHWNNFDGARKLIPFITDPAVGGAGADRSSDGRRRRVLRLLVMLPGTPYSNDREVRRRQRHAVVSALTGGGFVPSDETRLRYFRAPAFRSASDAVAAGSSNDPTLVGYETYEPAMKTDWGRWASVAVFWLNAEDFLRHPLHKVSALVAALDSGRVPDSGDATTVLLGPPSSSLLKAMFEEPEETPGVVQGFLQEVAQKTERDFKSLEISAGTAREALFVFSSQATIPVEWLVCRPDDEGCRAVVSGGGPTADDVAGNVMRRLRVASFHSAIADDGRVLEAVLQELVSRGACAMGRPAPTVVIVSEQDTVYGRLLDDVAGSAAKRIRERGPERCEIRIVEHGYLRGVDGEMPAAEDRARRDVPLPEDMDAAGRAQAVPSLPGGAFEQPFGAGRLDYVRRLSERLLEDGTDGTLVAIGVLGNDVYDKLLILQALRERHPGVLFFTTDMDARLLAPAVYPWTRNLVVGSAYGLSLAKAGAVTFRDSYQAALFTAVRQALDWQSARVAPDPRLFEISRTGVVPLGSGRAPNRDPKQTAVLLTPLAALAVFALVMRRRQREETARVRRRRYGFVAVFAAVAAACLYGFVQYWLPKHEPAPLFDGVSTVPMVVLQVTAIFFAVAVVAFANGRMRHALSHVAGRLGGTEPDHGLKAMRAAVRDWRSGNEGSRRAVSPWRWISAAFVSTWKYDVAGFDKGSEKKAAELWSDVLRYNGWWPRFARVGAGLLVGLLLRQAYFANVRAEQPLLGQAVTAPGWVEFVLPVMIFWAISYCRDTLGAWQAFIRAVGRFDVIGGVIMNRGRMQNEAAVRGHWSMDLLVRCTDLIGPVVVLPLILMVLLLLARSTLFEGWNWTPPLVGFHVGLGVYVLFIAIAFQREASHARAAVLDRLREARLGAGEGESIEIENVMEYIRSRRDGAFVPWTQHPILQTLALPLGSVALITLLETWIGR